MFIFWYKVTCRQLIRDVFIGVINGHWNPILFLMIHFCNSCTWEALISGRSFHLIVEVLKVSREVWWLNLFRFNSRNKFKLSYNNPLIRIERKDNNPRRRIEGIINWLDCVLNDSWKLSIIYLLRSSLDLLLLTASCFCSSRREGDEKSSVSMSPPLIALNEKRRLSEWLGQQQLPTRVNEWLTEWIGYWYAIIVDINADKRETVIMYFSATSNA